MAIVQISRITNRKGLTENLPQLAGAEFGWCTDSRRLFIGNGTLEDGAPLIGNTEILTEFSDITALSSYTYEDGAVGYIAQTGATPSSPVIRTVQAKLDDFASIRDFGAVGDGVADDTAAINRALFQLYCREPNTQIRRSLYFPAGTYRVSDTIIIPPYAKLVGEGADCSIIFLAPGDSSAPDYVARYGDSLQQSGVNMGNNGATLPRNIEISSMTFQTSMETNVFFLEGAQQCWFDSVEFLGPLTQSSIFDDLALANIAGVRFGTAGFETCRQITFDKCQFSGLTYGIKNDQPIQSVTVSNSDFHQLYQGVVLDSGATGFRVTANRFDTIYAEGVVYNAVNLNATAYNVFYNVGDGFGSTPLTAVIKFAQDNNISVGDFFARTDLENNIRPRVEILGGVTTTGSLIQIGRYSRETGRTFALQSAQSSAATIFVTSTDTVRAFGMDYTMLVGSDVRHGRFTVVAQPGDGSSATLSYTDDYTETADVGVTLLATQSGEVVTVRYTSTFTGPAATLTYSLAHLA